jgi:predicted transcriptional regulator
MGDGMSGESGRNGGPGEAPGNDRDEASVNGADEARVNDRVEASVDRGGGARGRQSRTVTRLTEPRALRAMAHPTRLSLIGVLRREGPLTATQAGELIGESSASCSFHLRQLAKYGLVEEAGGGKGRERPWRATSMFTSWPDVAESPEAAAASSMLRSVLAERYFEALARWLEAKPDETEEWQHAAHFGDSVLYVTADELLELADETQAMMDRFIARQTHPELRPPGARMVTFLHLAFPGDLSGARPREDPHQDPPQGPTQDAGQ